jgi:hypothetical protein
MQDVITVDRRGRGPGLLGVKRATTEAFWLMSIFVSGLHLPLGSAWSLLAGLIISGKYPYQSNCIL